MKAAVSHDPARFSWDRSAFQDVAKGVRYGDADRMVVQSLYRPFHRRWLEAGKRLNRDRSQLMKVFTDGSADNLAIAVPEPGGAAAFSVTCTRWWPDSKLVGAGNAVHYLPLWIYDSVDLSDAHPELFASGAGTRRHNVTDHTLASFSDLDDNIARDDIFFYVYGVLHSTDYRTAFAADLKKSLPRVPQVATPDDFWAFAEAGRELARLHTEYESVQPWPDLTYTYAAGFDARHADAYRVLKMKHPKIVNPADPDGGKVDDLSRIIYNDWITIGAIPERAYGYELGPRSAIAWVIESNRVKTDKPSGIRNDPNDWAIEHGDPTYILDLVGRIVTVSMQTLDIVESLPHLDL